MKILNQALSGFLLTINLATPFYNTRLVWIMCGGGVNAFVLIDAAPALLAGECSVVDFTHELFLSVCRLFALSTFICQSFCQCVRPSNCSFVYWTHVCKSRFIIFVVAFFSVSEPFILRRKKQKKNCNRIWNVFRFCVWTSVVPIFAGL